jgi:hypothetical protein
VTVIPYCDGRVAIGFSVAKMLCMKLLGVALANVHEFKTWEQEQSERPDVLLDPCSKFWDKTLTF